MVRDRQRRSAPLHEVTGSRDPRDERNWPNGSKLSCAKTQRHKGYIVRQRGGGYKCYLPSGSHRAEASDFSSAMGKLR